MRPNAPCIYHLGMDVLCTTYTHTPTHPYKCTYNFESTGQPESVQTSALHSYVHVYAETLVQAGYTNTSNHRRLWCWSQDSQVRISASSGECVGDIVSEPSPHTHPPIYTRESFQTHTHRLTTMHSSSAWWANCGWRCRWRQTWRTCDGWLCIHMNYILMRKLASSCTQHTPQCNSLMHTTSLHNRPFARWKGKRTVQTQLHILRAEQRNKWERHKRESETAWVNKQSDQKGFY